MSQEKKKKSEEVEVDGLQGILEDVTAKGKALLSEGLEEAREIFEEKKEYVKEKAGELKEKKVGEIVKEVKSFVKENPWTGVAIGVGLGFILGSILKSED